MGKYLLEDIVYCLHIPDKNSYIKLDKTSKTNIKYLFTLRLDASWFQFL